MSTVRMQVIPADEAAQGAIEAVMAPAITGKGETDYICGSCGSVLLRRMFYAQVRDLVLHCGRCGATNQVPPAHTVN